MAYGDRDHRTRHCNQRREMSDLLRWSMGREPRFGRGYVDYEPPAHPALPPPTVASLTAGLLARLREASIRALRAGLVWWLSPGEKDRR